MLVGVPTLLGLSGTSSGRHLSLRCPVLLTTDRGLGRVLLHSVPTFGDDKGLG